MIKPLALNRSIVVVGHPRSGTSLTCQLVESSGIQFPNDFEGDEYNREGYYEMAISKEVSKDLMAEAMTEENTQKMNQVVQRLNEIEDWSGLKLVRIPAVFFYRHVAKEMKLVGAFRHPADVKASLFKRGIGEFPISWIKNNNALIAAYENIDQSILVSYESLLKGKEHVKEGFQKLGLDVDLSLASSDKRTQANSKVYVNEDALNLYQRLKELERESCVG
ncbi:MAG: hypothetical protein ACOCZX_00080 [Candidatus Bipolaricaulota bacterium]